MDVNISKINMLDSFDFDEITITEISKDYFEILVSVNKKVFRDEIFNDEFDGLSSLDKVVAIIQKFLNSFKISGVTKFLVLYYNNGKYPSIYAQNGNKQLHLKLINSQFRCISKTIMNKYFNDRYDFLFNNNINLLQLQSDDFISKYESVALDCIEHLEQIDGFDLDDINECIKYTMMTDADGNIAISEREFIKEFLYYKFWQFGEIIQIFDIRDKRYNNYVERVIKCGDMIVKFPNSFEFSFLGNIVKEYNEELLEIRQNENIRQLKMEGF